MHTNTAAVASTTLKEAKALAKICIQIGEGFGRNTQAILSNMDNPLGYAIGNTNEMIEAIETLKGNGPADLIALCHLLVETTLIATGLSPTKAKQKSELTIHSGAALKQLELLIQHQGGNYNCIHDYSLLPQPKLKLHIEASQSGFIQSCDALAIAKAACILGAGREQKTDNIDHSVGINLLKKPGESVNIGEPIAELWSNTKGIAEAQIFIKEAFIIGSEKPESEFDNDHFVFQR